MISTVALLLCGTAAALQAPLTARSAVAHSPVSARSASERAGEVVMAANIRELREVDFPPVFKLVHRRRILDAAMDIDSIDPVTGLPQQR